MVLRQGLIGGTACAILLTASGVAHAQSAEPAAPPAQAADSSNNLDEVIVQARRRDENVQDVPLSVTALSAQDLAEGSIADVQDLTRSVPNLTVSPSTGRRDTATFGIRSQRNIQDGIDADPSVGVYFSDMYVARPYGINQAFYDMQSVQILKGPQGTLFGRNTTGGAVLFQPARPNFDGVEGYVEGQVSDYDGRLVSGAVNLPLGDTLALRVAGQVEERDGYTRNLFDGATLDNTSYRSFRAGLLFEPNTNFSNYLVVDSYDSGDDGSSNYIVAARPGGNADAIFPGIQDEIAAQQARGNHVVNLDGDSFSQTDTTTVVNTTTIQAGSLTFKNIAGWRRVDLNGAVDLDGSPFPILHLAFAPNAEQMSEEFQVQGEALNGALDWIGGLYYFNENGVDISLVNLFGFLSVGTGGTAENTSYSVFGQGSYTPPGLSRLTFNAGLRYTWDERSVLVTPTAFGACAPFPVNGVDVCSLAAEDSWEAPTWTLGVDYQVNDDTLLYVSHRRGYRSGGFNLASRSAEEVIPAFDPETITDIEFGVKSDWLLAGMPTRTNLAVYYGQGDDIQRTVFGNGAGTLRVLNAASASFYGAEFEGEIRPVDGLTLSAFLSWDHGEYDEFMTQVGGLPVDVSNSAFPSTPEYKLGLGARYEIPLSGNAGELAFGANYFWQDEIFFDPISVLEPESHIAGYDTLNVRVEWNSIGGSSVDAAAFARNVLDNEYAAGGTGSQADFGFSQNQAGEPRIVGLQLRYSFGE